MAAGPREDLERRGPFDRVLGSPRSLRHAGVRQLPLPLGAGDRAPACTSSSSSGRTCSSRRRWATSPRTTSTPACCGAWSTPSRAGRPSTVDMYYGRPGMPDFGCALALRAYEDAGHAHGVRAGEPRPEPLRARAQRAVPRDAFPRSSPRRSAARRWATRGRWTT